MPKILKRESRIIPERVYRCNSSSAGKRAAREILLLSIKAELGSEEKEHLAQVLAGNVDWEYLLSLAVYQDVTPLLAHNLVKNAPNGYIPEPYLEKLNRIYHNNIYRNIILSEELVKVLLLFSKAGIDVITLKGTVLAEQLYANLKSRSTTDIDILIHKEQLSQAASLLLESGYTPSTLAEEIGHPFHRVFYKQEKFPLMIELHWDLNDPRFINIPLSDIWRHAHLQVFQGGSTRVLSSEDNLIYLAIGLFRDNIKKLKYYGDITALLKIYRDTLDWNYIVASAKSLGIETSLYYSLKWAQEFLDAPFPAPVIRTLRPAPWRRCLIEIIINSRTPFSLVKWRKLNDENSALVYSLMMSRTSQSLAVLAKYRGDGRRAAWLRTIVWIILVFGIALYSKTVNSLCRFCARLKRAFTAINSTNEKR
jgi:hypothetical protein